MNEAPARTPSFAIRAGRPDDRAALVRVFLSSRQAFIPYAPLAHDEDAIERWIGELLDHGGGVTVACLDGAAVGFLAVNFGAVDNWIDQLYLAPGHTGKGFGARLLAHAIRLLGPRLPIRLHTFQANAGARRFYERAGFKAVAWGDGTDNEEGLPDVLYELAPLP